MEQITLDLTAPQATARFEDGRFFSLSTATTEIELEGRWVSIYRWVLSARESDRVSASLIEGQWEPVAGADPTLPAHPLVRVHSPQVWGQIRVVLLDLYPWRLSDGRVEVLKGGRLEVTIRHRPEDPIADPADLPPQGLAVANRLTVTVEPPIAPLLQRIAGALPEGGSWLKIPLGEDGLYHLTGSYLSDAGLSLGTLDPATLRLFAPTNLGRPLPDSVGAPWQDNLTELAIHVRDGGAGQLDENDDILFYGQGPRGFDLADGDLTFIQNPYANEAYVWLHIPEAGGGTTGKRMTYGAEYVLSASVVTTGRDRYHREVDVFNGFHSGPYWYEQAITKAAPYNLFLSTPGLRSSDATYLRVRLRGGNESGSHRVALALNNKLILTSTAWSAHDTLTLAPAPAVVADTIRAGLNAITLTNITTNPDPREEVWLDWAEIDYGLDLTADEDALTFLAGPREGSVNIQLAGFSTRPVIVDITDTAHPVFQQAHNEDSHWLFTVEDLSAPRRYIAATEAKVKTPASPILYPGLDFATLRQLSPQADYIVITDPTLLEAARELAGIHAQEVRTELRLTTLVTTVSEIYEEFSGGVVDPLALRFFLRWAYEKWQRPVPRLVLLFGDGDYDYRNLTGLSRNLVPTIQVDAPSETDSRTVDDAFVYLDSLPVTTPLPDMGIGRIAVSTLEEAEAAVEIVRTYMVSPEPGPWRQRVLLAADDPVRPGDGETYFIKDTERFAQRLPPYLQLEKIYLTEYAEVRDPATNTVIKPDATADLIRSVNQGVALINYIGHGSASQWAQEQLLVMDRDRPLLQPGNRLPVWFAGTCAWGRFDQLEIPSMSEVITASTEISGIAVVSAVRALHSVENTAFIDTMFSKTFPGKQPSPLRIGEIVNGAKNGGLAGEKFHLFGDPAILIAFPRDSLTLNALSPDTLKVLGTASYSGTTSDGAITAGECLVTVLDAPRQVTRQDISYTLPGGPIFRGAVTIKSGTFDGHFVIPKDINYSGNPATIIAYAWSDTQEGLLEQIGYRSDLIIQGTDTTILDSTGPLITLLQEDRPLVSNDALPEGARIDVELKDPLGINLTGEVGHAIRVWVDDESSADVMDPLFLYNSNSYTTGRFPYQFDPVLSGRHEFYVEAWDGANNKAISITTIYLVLEQELDVFGLFNYPNPFVDYTEFVYTLTAPEDAPITKVTITIFTLNGVKVVTLESDFDPGRLLQRLPWDGRDAFGDQIANGAYLYRFRVETFDGRTVTQWGRLARLR